MDYKKSRICLIGHSMIALRQQFFGKELARQGNEVLLISPQQWGDLKAQPEKFDNYELATVPHMGDDIYNLRLLASDKVVEFQPDWIICQQEPGSVVAEDCLVWKRELDCRLALFTWENISLKGGYEVLKNSDVVICGNPEAEALVKPYNENTALLLQAGIPVEHFKARPGVERSVQVGHIGRRMPEKGIMHLTLSWPTAQLCEWTPYRELPWRYSQIEVLVAYSQDSLPQWKEQAPNYVCLEALSCGCKVIASDTPAMAYWLEGCPAVIHVPQQNSLELKKAIEKALEMEADGRQWVIERFSNEVVAERLLEVLR